MILIFHQNNWIFPPFLRMVWYDGYVTLWALCLFLHVVIKGEICGAALDQTDLRTKSSEVPCSKSTPTRPTKILASQR